MAVEKSSLPHFLTSLLSDSTFYNGSGKVKSTALYRTFSLHFSSTRIFTTAVEKSSLPHFTALSHFTSLRLDFLQRQWKSRVYRTLPHFLTSLLSDSNFYNGSGKVESTALYRTFSLHFSPTRLFTTAVEKSSIDSTFYSGSGKVESTSLSLFTSLRINFSQRQWKSRIYLTLPPFLTSLLSDSTFYNVSGKVEYRLDFSQRHWKSRVYLTLPHLLTSLLSYSTFYNVSGKVEYRLDFLQPQWKSRV